ncbi:HAD-IIIC family phosphatase [Actinokineospora sp. HUAS TT18]|uniref:HAD-IIIC family phosphatase n=1 Tax=Actinokineospora sp. HUAS TT18 TaxID=3447451 RepID=UPI003F51BA10
MTNAPVKCVVWDLDGTLWDGDLTTAPDPFADAVRTLHTLDERGVLHAATDRGSSELAEAHLADKGLLDLFTWVEVGPETKSDSIRRVAEELDIALDAIAFIDDDPTERAEVAAALPAVRCYPATDAARLPSLFSPHFATPESRRRRHLYRADRQRRLAEAAHVGAAGEFLAGLDLVMRVRPADPADLDRVLELTTRAHQLNTTGRTFTHDELLALCASPRHEILVADLRDRFGPYGTIGVAVTAYSAADSVLELLLISCRVLSRGAAPALLDHLLERALADGRRPVAEFVRGPANRVMLITLRFAGFAVVHESDRELTLAIDPRDPPAERTHPVTITRHEWRAG